MTHVTLSARSASTLAALYNAHPEPVFATELDPVALARLVLNTRPLVQLETVSSGDNADTKHVIPSYRLTPHGVRCGRALNNAVRIDHQVHITAREGHTAPMLDAQVQLW